MVRWGILGPGGIARRFFRSAVGSTTGRVTALGTRDPSRPDFAEHFPGTRVHGSYEALVADPNVDAIYIATPHPFHCEWAIRSARAGKHVLCEKPMGMSAEEVTSMFDAARERGVFMGEAFMYRQHPLTQAILDLVTSGRLGRVQLLKSSFGLSLPAPDPNHRLFSRKLGGGAILDVGGYPVSVTRLIAGAQAGPSAAEPVLLSATGVIGPTGVDECSFALLRFPDDVFAQLACSVTLKQDNVLHVVGTAGRIEIDDFWVGTGVGGGTKNIRFFGSDGTNETITINEQRYLYGFQFESVNTHILKGILQFSYPGLDKAESIANARVLDEWLAAVYRNLSQPKRLT